MKAQLRTEHGKTWLEVQYDPRRLNWDEAIAAGLASYGLKIGKLPVIATPMKTLNVNEAENG